MAVHFPHAGIQTWTVDGVSGDSAYIVNEYRAQLRALGEAQKDEAISSGFPKSMALHIRLVR